MQFENTHALITGAASGLGAATARHFTTLGARVSLLDLDEDGGRRVASELGEKARFYPTDVTDPDSVASIIARATETFGAPRICCNFAGIAPAEKTVGREGPADLALFRKVIEVNLLGTYNICRLVAHAMSTNESEGEDGSRGVIINTASVAAYEGQVGQTAYSASKGGVAALTLPMARDLARFGIRVNAIAPGLIHTPMFDAFPQKVVDALSEQPLYPTRLGHAREVALLAEAIVRNPYLNGECIRLDGGIRMQAR